MEEHNATQSEPSSVSSCQPVCKLLKGVSIRSQSIVEARGIDEMYLALKNSSGMDRDLGGAYVWVLSASGFIDIFEELTRSQCVADARGSSLCTIRDERRFTGSCCPHHHNDGILWALL